ncbi:MAG: hypothetical protein KGQ16_15050, partial [Cyanobacteria bacterium REEB444]|nr:hypothetical protein [Cyanobacteria bacterium REEB444]
IKSFLNQLKQIKTGWHNRDEFIEQYDRRNIMRKYADHLLSYMYPGVTNSQFTNAKETKAKNFTQTL